MKLKKKGFASIGVDLNPIACLISKIYTTRIPLNLIKISNNCVEQSKKSANCEKVELPNIDHWFKKDIQLTLNSLKKEIFQISNRYVQNCLKVAFSSILVRVSNQESDTRYAAIEKEISQSDVYNLFLDSVKRIQKLSKNNTSYLKIPSQVIHANVLEVEPKKLKWKVGLVITSPPYPNAYEYWLYHKYRMWWLNFDPLKVKELEIGARAHFFKKEPHNAETFQAQMTKLFELISKTLVKTGFACFVIGDSKIKGKIVDNSKILESVAKTFDMSLHYKISRKIKQNKKSFNTSYSRLKKEKIIIFKRN